MVAKQKTEPTIEELISTLNHSSLPTLVIEGKDDLIIFRRLEEQSENLSLSVLPVGGRNNVLALFDRLSEIRSNAQIAFVADLDLWVFSQIPPQYQSDKLIFTNGYSIENDAFRDANCISLLLDQEKQTFLQEVNIFVEWFALTVSRSPNFRELDVHPNRILDDDNERTRLMTTNADEDYPTALRDSIIADYSKYLRGKSLFDLFQRQMRNRNVRHNRRSIMEIAAVSPGKYINSLFTRARDLIL